MKTLSLLSKPLRYDLALEAGALLRWWASGLLAWLPAVVQRRLAESAPGLVVEIRGREVVFLGAGSEGMREVERYPLEALLEGGLREQGPALLGDAEQIILSLPADQVLARVISLPLAAEANLRQVVGFEIDRLTPFATGQLYYDVTVLERQSELKRIKIRFIAVSRAWLEPLLNRLAEMGLAPDSVVAAGEDSAINLLPAERRPQRNRLLQRLHRVLIGLALGLLLLAGVLPLWQQRKLAVDLLPRVAAAQKEAEQILALRQELDSAIESSQFLFQKRRENALTIDLLNELTAILPDGTWVENLEIKGKEIRIQGQSSQASALLGLVEGSKWFHGATFAAPVTADRATGQDRFYLAAQIAREP